MTTNYTKSRMNVIYLLVCNFIVFNLQYNVWYDNVLRGVFSLCLYTPKAAVLLDGEGIVMKYWEWWTRAVAITFPSASWIPERADHLWRNEPPAWFSWHSELCNLVSLLLLAIRYMYNSCYEIVGRNFSTFPLVRHMGSHHCTYIVFRYESFSPSKQVLLRKRII